MGTDKASLHWRGVPLWRHQLCLAAAIGADEILISGRPDGPYREAAVVVTDELADAGPLAGLASLLAAMQSEWLVAVAVDMPFLDGATLRELLAARAGRTGVVPHVNGHAEPLASVYPRTVQSLISRRLRLADRSLQSFVREAEAAGLVRLHPWPAELIDSFRSLNTSAEYAAAQALARTFSAG